MQERPGIDRYSCRWADAQLSMREMMLVQTLSLGSAVPPILPQILAYFFLQQTT